MTPTRHVQVDPSNLEQARAWGGDEGAYWAAHADQFDRSIAAYHDTFLDAARLTACDRVLDIGCGSGQTTRDAARRAPEGDALGVDLSSQLIAVARERAVAEGVANARFEQADAQIYAFADASFDVAISRTGAMLFGDPQAGFANIARAVRRGGRLTLLTWRPLSSNEWISELTTALAAGRNLPAPPPDAPGPFALADPDRVRAILDAAGFADVKLDALAAPMWFGTNAGDAYTFVLGLLGWMLADVDDEARGRALDALRTTLATHETATGVVYQSGAWLVRAQRT